MKASAAAAGGGPLGKLLDQVVPRVQAGLAGAAADLGLIFATNHFEDELTAAAESLRQATGVRTLIGCTAEGVIGPAREHEREPALAAWVAHLPGATVEAFHLSPADIESAESPGQWWELLKVGAEKAPSFLLLGDPFSVDVNTMLDGVNRAVPGRPVVGGMASGAEAPGQCALLLNQDLHRDGAVGVVLGGKAAIDTVVSQGCRPIGRPYVITKAERNIIHELGGTPPLAVLREIYDAATPRDQQLMEQGVFLGRAVSEQKDEFKRGDFLIRNLMGADQRSGAIAIAELVRLGITVQFHVRDAATADEDLKALLGPAAAHPPIGALLFSCNGRGTRLFKEKDHDIGVLRQALGAPAAAGFFCAGELGPVGGKNFIHGHTASIALVRQRG